MQVGVIGLGNIGAFHAGGLKELPGVERITVADLDISRARRLASELGATAVSSVDEAISAGIEAVVVATSTPSYAELV